MDDSNCEIVEDELKVLQSIFMENYSKTEIRTKRPWKEDLIEELHSIKLDCDGITMTLNFKFTSNYPREAPVLSLSDCDIDANELLDHINKQLPSLIGTEMIYEITLIIQDYCRGTNQSSAHEEMTESRSKTISKLQEQRELELEKQRLYEELEGERLRSKIQEEIERKQILMKESKKKKLSNFNVEENLDAFAKFDPVISDATILPYCFPFLSDGEQLVYLTNGNDTLYILRTITDTPLTSQDIKKWKTESITCCSPLILDIQITADNTAKILFKNYKHLKISDVIQLGETLSIKTASAIANGLLTVLECFGSHASFMTVTLDSIYFDHQMNPVIDYLPFVPSETPLDVSFNHVGKLMLQMLSKELSNPLAAATKLGNLNPELGEFIKLLLDPQDLTLKDFQSHPFFTTFSRPITPPSVILPIPPPISTADPQSRYQTDFEELEFLGRGGFGHVLKSRNLIDGRTYAIKKIRLNPQDTESSRRLITEVQTLSRVQSEYVVRYYQAWFETGYEDEFGSEEELSVSSYDSEDDTDDWFSSSNNPRMVLRDLTPSIPNNSGKYTQVLYIQMEFCEKKTLRDAIDAGLEIEQSWKFFRQLLEGLGHLHHLGVIHRDLKPSNVFLDNNLRVKLGDFGLATAKKDTSRSTLSIYEPNRGLKSPETSMTSEVGTPVYIAPEIMAGIGRYNSKVDMYSLGIVFFEMIYRMETGMGRVACLRDLRLPEIVFPNDYNHELLADQEKIIRMLLDHAPKQRPSCSELLQSSLVPANVEGEYINQELIRTIQQRNPTYYGRLIQSLFLQQTDIHKDFAYDYNSNSVFDPLYCLISSHVHFHARKVFGRHGALHISTPILIPKSSLAVECYPLKKPAELLDSNGDVVQLPFDLTVPFARSLAQSTEDILPSLPLKRFCIDKSYRKNTVGGQPRFVAEADFDIVYDYGNESLIPEAEVIKVVFEVLEFGQIHKFLNLQDFGIRINYTQTLDHILNDCHILPGIRDEVLEILSSLRKPFTLNQIRQSLQKLGVNKDSIDRLVSMDISVSISSSSDLNQLTKTFGNEIAQQSIKLASSLELLGLKNHITFDPLLVYNPTIFQGLVFQIYRKSSGTKYDIYAAGGRYESLLKKMRGPFSLRANVNAIGVNIAISKLIANVAAAQGHLLEESKTSLAHLNPCRKADVLLVSFGSNSSVQSAKLELASQMWASGVSCELSFHPSMTNYEDLDQYKNQYQNAVILKPKGHDSFTIKVRNFITKSENEVDKSSLLFLIQGNHPSRSQINLFGTFETDHTAVDLHDPAHEIIAIPNPGKKKKGMGINQLHFDKAKIAVQSSFLNSKVFIVEITHVDLLKLSKVWFMDTSLLKKLNLDCNHQYALDVQKKILKAFSADSSLCWIYSMLDSKAIPVLKP